MFIPNTYTITASCGNNGMISPSGVSSYLYHQDAEYVITANPGYYIASVTYDGNTYDFTQDLAPTTFTVPFLSIEEDHTISATFAQYIFTVTVNAGANGAIAPATSTFAYGATPTFAITPDAGYSIVDVTVDGTSVGAVSTYTFTALDADHTIAATFERQIRHEEAYIAKRAAQTEKLNELFHAQEHFADGGVRCLFDNVLFRGKSLAVLGDCVHIISYKCLRVIALVLAVARF